MKHKIVLLLAIHTISVGCQWGVGMQYKKLIVHV